MSNRFLLYIAFTLVLFMIWQQWKIEQMPINKSMQATENASIINQDLPETASSNLNEQKKPNYEKNSAKDVKAQLGKQLIISNNELRIVVDTAGGTIKEAKLLKYFETTEPGSENIKLLDYKSDFYVAQSGLLHDRNSSEENLDELAPNHHDLFFIKDQKNNGVTLEWRNKNKGIVVLKEIYLDDSGYKINIENTIINNSNKAYTLA